jgi:hypothetical protein
MNNKGTVLFSCAFMLFSTVSISAQTGSIRGRVLRKNDNAPLYNASVRVQGNPKSTRTDKDGNYSFEQLTPDQDYTLEITKSPLYEDGGTKVNVKANAPTTAPDVSLLRLDTNANAIKQTINALAELYKAGDLDTLEKRLNTLAGQCKGEDTGFCKNITATDKAVAAKKQNAAKSELDKMLASAGPGTMD